MASTEQAPGARGPESDDTAALEAGLDALETQVSTRTPRARSWMRSVVPPIIAIALVIIVWQILYSAGIKPPYILPSPADVWHEFVTQVQAGTLQEAIWNSVRRGLSGFVVAVIVATPLGVVIARVPTIRAAIGPILSALQTLPSVAWVPAAVLWFGTTDAAIYAVILLGAVPSIANGVVAGFDQTPVIYGRVGRMLGAKRWTMIAYIRLPAAMPGFVAGLKQGWAFAWRSLMAAEIITFSPQLGLSLGQLLNIGRDVSSMSLIITTIFAILFVGLMIELLLFAPLERRILRSRGLGDMR